MQGVLPKEPLPARLYRQQGTAPLGARRTVPLASFGDVAGPASSPVGADLPLPPSFVGPLVFAVGLLVFVALAFDIGMGGRGKAVVAEAKRDCPRQASPRDICWQTSPWVQRAKRKEQEDEILKTVFSTIFGLISKK